MELRSRRLRSGSFPARINRESLAEDVEDVSGNVVEEREAGIDHTMATNLTLQELSATLDAVTEDIRLLKLEKQQMQEKVQKVLDEQEQRFVIECE